MHFTKVASVTLAVISTVNAAALHHLNAPNVHYEQKQQQQQQQSSSFNETELSQQPEQGSSLNGTEVVQQPEQEQQQPPVNETEIAGACDKIRAALDDSEDKYPFLSSALNNVEKATKGIYAKGPQQYKRDDDDESGGGGGGILGTAMDVLKDVLGGAAGGGGGSDAGAGGSGGGGGLGGAFDIISKAVGFIKNLGKRDEESLTLDVPLPTDSTLSKRELLRRSMITSALGTIAKTVLPKVGSAVFKQAFGAISKLVTSSLSGMVKRGNINPAEVRSQMQTVEDGANESGAGEFVKMAVSVIKQVIEGIISNLGDGGDAGAGGSAASSSGGEEEEEEDDD